MNEPRIYQMTSHKAETTSLSLYEMTHIEIGDFVHTQEQRSAYIQIHQDTTLLIFNT